MEKRFIALKNYLLRDMNPIIRLLIISDLILFGAAGLLGPIFALFIEDFIIGGNAKVAGIAAGIYLLSKSILQIPSAYILDKIRGEKDDFWMLFSFTLIASVIPIFYIFIETPLQLYITQFILGIFTAFTFPAFMAIFTRHIDKGKEGTEWGIYFTLTDVATAILSVVGGYIATIAGFPFLIIMVVCVSIAGSLILIPIRKYIRKWKI